MVDERLLGINQIVPALNKKTKKDLISILVVSLEAKRDIYSVFSKEAGFSIHWVDSIKEASLYLSDLRVDILILGDTDLAGNQLDHVEELSRHLNAKYSVFFAVLKKYPDPKVREILADAGISDVLVPPFQIGEIKKKINIYQEHYALVQEFKLQKKNIEKQEHYLRRFQKELKSVKADLYEERLSLNNALKQINRLSDERKRLKLEKKELKTLLSENIDGFFSILCSLITHNVEINRGHGERVAHIAEFAGKAFKLDQKSLEDLQKAAMLHEVGLLFVPADIRNRPVDQLNDFERDLVHQSLEKGSELLKNCSRLDACAQIIESMGENSDGTGRPNGLKRRYIPLPSRILAGADVFETLKDKGFPDDFSSFLAAFEEYSGTRLDPSVVAVLEKYAVLHMGSDDYRVRGVGIHQLEPGMTLGTAIFSNTGTKLFSVNTLLTQDAIDKIKRYNKGYPVDETVYIKA